jgi:hypothetical protein
VNTDAPADSRSETRFEDRLLAAILADFDNLTPAPALTRAPARPSRRARYRHGHPSSRTRRTVPALVAGTAGVTLAVAGVTALSHHTPSHHAPSGRAPGGTSQAGTTHLAQPKLQTAAYVVHHMRAAVAANTAVMVTREHAPDSQTGKPVFDETWSSRQSDTSRSADLDPSGTPTSGYVVTVTPKRTVSIAINYQNHTWRKTTYPFGSSSSSSGPAPLPVTPKQEADQLRADVAAGTVTLVGPATVDGQSAIELTEGSFKTGVQDTWVDPATYLPIREIDTAPGLPQSSDQTIQDDYQWLPDTPANLKLLTAAAAIPAGFTEVGGHAAGSTQHGR